MSTEDEIAAWLRAQAEADITAAGKATPGPWEFEGDDPTDDELFTVCEDGPQACCGDVVAYVRGNGWQAANGRHMERHDPLAETGRAESVLAVIREYEAASAKARSMHAPVEHRWPPPHVNASVRAWARAVRLLAYGYRSRPGYREEEWKP